MEFKWILTVKQKEFTLKLNSRIILCLIILCLLLTGINYIIKENETQIELPKTIVHACGEIDDYVYTNSKEALLYNYEKGQKAFEVDFLLSADELLVCKHDWDDGSQIEFSSEMIPTGREFKNSKILNEYTPMTIYDLIDIMKKHPDIYIVTDTKFNDEERIRKEFESLKQALKKKHANNLANRFFIQIYSDNMYKVINEIYPFENYIYTLYQQDWHGEITGFYDYCYFCNDNNIKYITMWHDLIKKDIAQAAKNYDIKIFVHTVNNAEYANELLEMGAYGIYTDCLTIEDLEETK